MELAVSSREQMCICVVQARFGSSRLPGKILKNLNGKPVLQWVLERCASIKGVDQVICAVADTEADDAVASLAEELGVKVFRGSEQDVLARYWGAVAEENTRYVMRVTSDCPFLDPSLCAEVLAETDKRGFFYGATGAFPNGLACEVFRKEALEEAYKKAQHPTDREHVTLWLKRQYKDACFVYPGDKKIARSNRWVLDYPEDYEALLRIAALLEGRDNETSWKTVLHVVRENPGIRAINAARIADWHKKTAAIHASVSSEGGSAALER